VSGIGHPKIIGAGHVGRDFYFDAARCASIARGKALRERHIWARYDRSPKSPTLSRQVIYKSYPPKRPHELSSTGGGTRAAFSCRVQISYTRIAVFT
jgi:hypothetical protein